MRLCHHFLIYPIYFSQVLSEYVDKDRGGQSTNMFGRKRFIHNESYLTKGMSRPLKTWIFWKLVLVETLAFRWQQSPACSLPRWWSCGCRTRCTSLPPGRWSSFRRSWIRDSCHGWPGCHDTKMENLSSDRNIFVLSSNIEIDNILEKWKQFSSPKKFFWSWLTSCRWLERIKLPVSAPIRESLQNRKITLVTGHLHVLPHHHIHHMLYQYGKSSSLQPI